MEACGEKQTDVLLSPEILSVFFLFILYSLFLKASPLGSGGSA